MRETIEEREKVRELIREQMRKGELDSRARRWVDEAPRAASTAAADVEEDAFFGDD